ncbi:hypothetical protein Q4602_02115 [Paraglaciecola chathamensis]|jgi:hypothetical protein|uniref:hypothetical protein n=1 Tax=Paraglaciecola chathamensis TaxID=368405 RepID=UPI0027057DE2|nr:hypothetical protein [Paraglaciecola chathamensis]MDO6838252.1 hypothetical protein [Paraglaciecola chathamensis]
MNTNTYSVNQNSLQDAFINLSQVSAMLNMLAENGDGGTCFTSHEDAIQVIHGCRQMINDTKTELESNAVANTPAHLSVDELPSSGM